MMILTNSQQLAQIRSYFQGLTTVEKRKYIAKLSKEEAKLFWLNPRLFLFDKQIIPNGDWRYCLLRCGRRFGKSFSGSAWIAEKVISGCHSLGLCGEDYSSVRDIMVKNVISWFPKGKAKYLGGDQHKIIFEDYDCEIYCYTSDKEVKGPSLEYLWCDEVGNWCDRLPDKIRIRFDSLDTAVSVGKHPQTIITTTPRAFPFFFDFQEKVDNGDTNYFTMTGTMFDNPTLSEGYKQKEIDKYKNDPVRLRQEIYGDLVYENPQALWQKAWIDDHRVELKEFLRQVRLGIKPLKMIIICVDPAVTSKKTSDQTGIIVLAQDFSNEIYVLEDHTGRHSPDAWAKIIRDLFYEYKKNYKQIRIIAETNQGGDLVIDNCCALDSLMKPYIIGTHAATGSIVRAELPAAKYERGKVHHVGVFEALERQMLNYTGDRRETSPDRMDALVHGINYLIDRPKNTSNFNNLGHY